MDTSENDFDVVLSLIKNFNVSIKNFPEINTSFSLINIPFGFDITDSLIRIQDDAWNIIMKLYFSSTIDNSKIKLMENLELSIVLAKYFSIIATLKSIEKINMYINISPVRIIANFWERLPISAILGLGKISIIADATVGIWRKLSSWDYDDAHQEFPIGYWNTKLLSELDYKEEEEYV